MLITHAAVWYLSGEARLSKAAADFIERTAALRRKVAVSSISLAELIFLVEKGRLPQSAYDDLRAALLDPEHVFAEAVFDSGVVHAMPLVSRREVPDLPDRMIAATAIHLGVPVLSRDGKIRACSVVSIW